MEGGRPDPRMFVGAAGVPNTELVHELSSGRSSPVSNSAPFSFFLLSLNLEDRLLKGTIVLTLQMGAWSLWTVIDSGKTPRCISGKGSWDLRGT